MQFWMVLIRLRNAPWIQMKVFNIKLLSQEEIVEPVSRKAVVYLLGSKCYVLCWQEKENDQDEIMSIGTVGVSSISVPITVAITALDKGQIVAQVISLGKKTLKASVMVLAHKNQSKVVRSVFEL